MVASGSAVNCQVEQLSPSISQQAARHAAGVFALDAVKPLHLPAIGSKLLALQLAEEWLFEGALLLMRWNRQLKSNLIRSARAAGMLEPAIATSISIVHTPRTIDDVEVATS